jgi:hypothetical protein
MIVIISTVDVETESMSTNSGIDGYGETDSTSLETLQICTTFQKRTWVLSDCYVNCRTPPCTFLASGSQFVLQITRTEIL